MTTDNARVLGKRRKAVTAKVLLRELKAAVAQYDAFVLQCIDNEHARQWHNRQIGRMRATIVEAEKEMNP